MATAFEHFGGEIDIVAHFTAKPGKISELIPQLKKFKAQAESSEPHNLKYEILQYGDEVVVLEKYKHAEGLKAHLSSVGSEAEKLKPLLVDGSINIKAYEAIKA